MTRDLKSIYFSAYLLSTVVVILRNKIPKMKAKWLLLKAEFRLKKYKASFGDKKSNLQHHSLLSAIVYFQIRKAHSL